MNPTPEKRAAACTSVEEVEGMARHAQQMLARGDDPDWWEAIRQAAVARRAELLKGKR